MRELGLTDEPEAVALAAEVEAAERGRAPADRGWTIAFILTLFAIHIGRMRTDLTVLGLLSPAIAVLGDIALAVLIALLVINPLSISRGGDRPAGSNGAFGTGTVRQVETAGSGWTMRVADAWLRWRMRYAIRMRASRCFGTEGAEPGAPDRAANCRDYHGNRSGVGHESVIRHRELGRGRMERLGGVAD